MIKIKIFVLFALISFGSFGQKSQDRQKKIEWSVQLGGLYSSFQDAKFSNTSYNGFGGGSLQIGHVSEYKNSILTGNILVRSGVANSNTFSISDLGKTLIVYPNVNLSYHQKLYPNLSLGAKIDVFDFLYRNTEGLGNNATYFNNSINLYGSGLYRKQIKDNLQFVAQLDLGIFSFLRESRGFAFSAPQSVTESGSFNYQDDATSNPFALKFFEAKPIWSLLNLQTLIGFKYKERWTLSYTWSLRRFSTVKNYPTTSAFHGLNVKFNFINKIKPLKK